MPESKRLKIYFAGSIDGGREDAEIYASLIDFLGNYGEVLSTQVGDPDIIEKEAARRKEDPTYDRQIYDFCTSRVEEAAVMIADVSTRSHGVGIELGLASRNLASILCIYHKKPGERLSSMIRGGDQFEVREYETIEEAKFHIKEHLRETAPWLFE